MFSEQQLHTLAVHLQSGAAESSIALGRWVGREAELVLERVEQVNLADAAGILGESEQPMVACLMVIRGWLTGQLGLFFDDASGFALADLLLNRPAGTSCQWGDLEQSAVLETANIIGCRYLNAFARLSSGNIQTQELLPSPPLFHRDFPAALLQFGLVDQAQVSDFVLVTETEFHIEQTPARCDLLFIPDAEAILVLQERLSGLC